MGNSQGKKQKGKHDSILDCEDNLCDFLTVTRRCYDLQMDVAITLRDLADELDEMERDFQKTDVGLSVAGTALAVAGIGLSFVSLGTALVLTIAGLGISVGAAGIAASIAEKILQSKRMKKANKAVQCYSLAVLEYAPVLQRVCDGLATEEERERLHRVLTDSSVPYNTVRFREVPRQEDLCEACSKGRSIVTTYLRVEDALGLRGTDGGVSGKSAGSVAKFSLNMVTEASTLTNKVFKTMNPLTHAIRIGSHVLTGVGLILDIGSIVYYSLKLHQKRPSQVAEILRKISMAFEK